MFNSWFGKRKPRRLATRPLQLEQLESRLVPATTPFAPIGAFAPFGASSQPSVIFTFGPGGSVTTTKTGIGPYDGSEDTYVGVRNLANSGVTVTTLNLSNSSSFPIFGFDGDGIQSFGSPAAGTTGYEGPGTSFSNINANETAGTVTFNDGMGHGLLPGLQGYFSLEGSPSDINVRPITSAIRLNTTVFFPYRPNFARPSMHVQAWVILTNPGPDITGNITANFSLPGVTITPLTATQPVKAVGVNNGTPFLTFSGGLKRGQSVAVLVDFIYPPWMSTDAIRKALTLNFTSP